MSNSFEDLWTLDLEEFPTALDWAPNGEELLAGTAAGDLFLLHSNKAEPVHRWHGHDNGVMRAVWSPKGQHFATSGQDGTAKIWSANCELLHTFKLKTSWVEHIAWDEKGQLLAVSEGKRVRVWDLKGKLVFATPELENTVQALAFQPGGKFLAVAVFGGVNLFELRNKPARLLPWPGGVPLTLAWHPKGKYAACGGQDNTVHFWRIKTGKDSMMSGLPQKPRALSWNHKGTMLATSGAPAVLVWLFDGPGPEGRQPLFLEGHRGRITELAFDPNAGLLASGDKKGEVILWAPGKNDNGPLGWWVLDDAIAGLAWGVNKKGYTSLAMCDAQGTLVARRFKQKEGRLVDQLIRDLPPL